MKPRIINIKTLKERNYNLVNMGDYYSSIFGEIEAKTSFFIYGTSGSGKSVFTLQLADYFASNHGKSLYCSHEEALNKTMQSRAINFNISAPNLYIGAGIDFDLLKQKIVKNYYRMIIIDSVQYMGLSYNQVIELNALFAKRKLMKVFVSMGKTYKNPDCDTKIMHACDVKMFFDQGAVTIDSRYNDSIKKVRLFNPAKQGIVQPTLF